MSSILVMILPIPVYNFVNTSRWFYQCQYTILSILVDNVRVSAIRICIIYMYELSNSLIPVDDLANTCRGFGQYRRRYIFQDLGRFQVEIGDSKNMGAIRIWLQKGHFNVLLFDFNLTLQDSPTQNSTTSMNATKMVSFFLALFVLL